MTFLRQFLANAGGKRDYWLQFTGNEQAMWSIALVNYNRTITLITHLNSHILNKSVLSPTHIYVESTLGGNFSA